MLDAFTLAYPHPDLPCILDTDASDVAVGAVRSQRHGKTHRFLHSRFKFTRPDSVHSDFGAL